MLAAGCALFAVTACGSGNGNSAESIPVTSPGPPASTVTSPGTTVPVGAPATSTTSVVTPTTLDVGVRADELFVVWASGVLAIHDPDTGHLLRVITTIDTEGQFVYDPVRDPDGTTYLGTGVEDSWYSCETAQGTVVALTAEGEFATIGQGGAPVVSADGEHLAYVSSSECRPDPARPDVFVLTVTDSVVVRELATGEEQSWTFPGAFDDPSVVTVVNSVVWYGDALIALVEGRLVRLDLSDPAVPLVADGVVVQLATGDPGQMALLGARADGTILAQVFPGGAGAGTVRIVALDPTTGHEVAEIAALDQSTFAKIDQSGTRWAAVVDGKVIVDGSETILEQPPLPSGFDPAFEDRPDVVGW